MRLKNIFVYMIMLVYGAFSYSKVASIPTLSNNRKSRILIFTSRGGGGHVAVAKGLNAYLKDSYDVSTVNIFDVLAPFDTLRTLSFGKFSGEDFYNFCLQCRWTAVANKFVTIGRWGIKWRQNTIEWLLLEYFKYEKPDLITSVIPMLNGALLNVAKKLDIPLLVVTNDLDTTNYINGIVAPDYKKFRYTLSFDDPSLYEKIAPARIPAHQVRVVGFPLRPEFFKRKDIAQIKKDFNLPLHKPIVMLLMGGAGSLSNYRYVRALATLDTPVHLMVCLGRNERLRKNISKILLPKHITTTLIGFTDRIADLMAVSDVLITKPGPGSICEAVISCLPMLVDQTSGTLWWEILNINFVTKNRFGHAITNIKDINRVLTRYLKRPRYRMKIKENMRKFKRRRFDIRIKALIEEMLALK